MQRTGRTLDGYAKHRAALDALQANVNSNLDEVRDARDAAQAAFDAARHLRADLDRLVKRRCKNPASARCKGAQKTRARLVAGDKSLWREIKRTNALFLLGREFGSGELRSWYKGLCELEKPVARINRKLG